MINVLIAFNVRLPSLKKKKKKKELCANRPRSMMQNFFATCLHYTTCEGYVLKDAGLF